MEYHLLVHVYEQTLNICLMFSYVYSLISKEYYRICLKRKQRRTVQQQTVLSHQNQGYWAIQLHDFSILDVDNYEAQHKHPDPIGLKPSSKPTTILQSLPELDIALLHIIFCQQNALALTNPSALLRLKSPARLGRAALEVPASAGSWR